MWVVGIDPSAHKLAFYASHLRTGDTRMTKFTLPDRDPNYRRSSVAYNATESFLALVLRPNLDAVGPVTVFLEQPIYWRGGKSTIPLAQISGAVQAAVGNAADTKLVMVDNSKWKKQIVGMGNAKKDDISAWLRDNMHDQYVEAAGDQDLMDAVCIHQFGLSVVNLRARIRRAKEDAASN